MERETKWSLAINALKEGLLPRTPSCSHPACVRPSAPFSSPKRHVPRPRERPPSGPRACAPCSFSGSVFLLCPTWQALTPILAFSPCPASLGGTPLPHRLRGDEASVSATVPGRLKIWISNVKAARLASICCSSRLETLAKKTQHSGTSGGLFLARQRHLLSLMKSERVIFKCYFTFAKQYFHNLPTSQGFRTI